MRIDAYSFAVGVLIAFSGFVYIAVLSDYRGIGHADFCTTDEAFLSCAREWFDAIAILAGFLTVLFILLQLRSTDRHHREGMTLQTFEMRAKFARSIYRFIEPIEANADELAKVGRMDAAGRRSEVAVASVYKAVDRLSQLLKVSLEEVATYDDGTLAEMRDTALRELAAAWACWHRHVDNFGDAILAAQFDDDDIIFADVAALSCGQFTQAFRDVHSLVNRENRAPIRERLRRHLHVILDR